MSTKPPPGEKNNLDALAKKGLHMLRCAPKIWDPSVIPKSTKTSITACRETAKTLYGSGLGDMEYSKLLTDDYVCWFYEIVNNTAKTYMYYRCKSQDKQRTGEILYKLMVKTWLRIFHPFPGSHYVGLTCDINNPTFDPRIYEASKKPSNRSRSSRQKKNTPVFDLEDEEDDDEDPIQESEETDSFQKRSSMIEDIEESNTGNSAKKTFANNKRKTVEDIEDVSGEDTIKDASSKKYSTRPPPALNTTSLKENPTNMVTFVLANPSYFREYSVDFCFFKHDCDDQMISRFKRIDIQHVGKIISLLDSTKSTEDILETLPKKTPPVRKLKPTKHNGAANPTVVRKVPIAQQKEVAKNVSYFKEEKPTPPTTVPTRSLSEMVMSNPWSTAPILNAISRPRLPALINFKPETNFWKLMALKNYLVSCYPMLCNVELTQPLSECNVDQEKLLTIIFVNCFSKKKTIDNALLAKNILATCDIKFQNNVRVEIADAVYENDKLKYTFSSFAEHVGKSPPTKKDILLYKQTHLNYICSDRHSVIEQLMKKINAKQWTIKPHEAVEALTDMTKFCQSMDLFLLQTFVAAMNSWFVPCIDLNIITSDATKNKKEKVQ
jgi:hypothetical protein